LAACVLSGCARPPEAALNYEIEADAITRPLAAAPGDPARGREIVASREASCLFCHTVPYKGPAPAMGTIGPPLAGVGGRLTAGQIRLRIVDPTRVSREATMPAYFRVDGLDRVAQNLRGRPILSAQQVEDVVSYLMTLD
jgi:sulfur-oxidizing protein SoxX